MEQWEWRLMGGCGRPSSPAAPGGLKVFKGVGVPSPRPPPEKATHAFRCHLMGGLGEGYWCRGKSA